MLSPCIVVVGLSSAPVAMNRIRSNLPDATSGSRCAQSMLAAQPHPLPPRMHILPRIENMTATVKELVLSNGDFSFLEQFNQQVAAPNAPNRP